MADWNFVVIEDGIPKDTGCEFSPSCLSCPLPACRYDMPPKRAGAIVRETRLKALLAEGHSADECAAIMGVARRTIFRLKQFKALASLEAA